MTFFFEMFAMGVKNLHLHKLRSLLTALGIIIGVAAVIIMVGIGEGAKQAAMEQVKQLGPQNFVVKSRKPPESADAGAKQQRTLAYGIKREDLARLSTLPGIVNVVPLRNTEQRVVHNDTLVNANAIGTTPNAFDVIHLRLSRGRPFNQVDYDRSAPVCVVGAAAARGLFPYEDPIGQHIQVGSQLTTVVILEVVGVLEPTGLRGEGASMVDHEFDNDVYFPLTLAKGVFGDIIMRRTSGSFERKEIQLTEVWLQADRMDQVEALASAAENTVAQYHPGPAADYQVKAPIQILRSAEKTQAVFNFVLVGVASFALVVGGIGIMNIMLASVTERTKEIGIRRALGAKRKHITLQFLIETTVISLSGGLIGIAFGIGGALAIPVLVRYFSGGAEYPTAIASWSVLGSFIVSGLIGVGFGMYPAVMAARMNPIEALRHE